ncbi:MULTISPECIES: hypothetical protein [Arthrobacter]|uniref:hypothetical protein n=1 Tax=Arthrobacter TaxID=1663 RepID=UPI0012B60AEE|nr:MULTISPECIES: hypothetical protein [Arthrobacter]
MSNLTGLQALTNLEYTTGQRASVTDVSSLGGIIQVEMQEQRVSAGEVRAGATVPNQLRGFDAAN